MHREKKEKQIEREREREREMSAWKRVVKNNCCTEHYPLTWLKAKDGHDSPAAKQASPCCCVCNGTFRRPQITTVSPTRRPTHTRYWDDALVTFRDLSVGWLEATDRRGTMTIVLHGLNLQYQETLGSWALNKTTNTEILQTESEGDNAPQSTVVSALGVSAIMRYINRRFTYLHTYTVIDDNEISSGPPLSSQPQCLSIIWHRPTSINQSINQSIMIFRVA